MVLPASISFRLTRTLERIARFTMKIPKPKAHTHKKKNWIIEVIRRKLNPFNKKLEKMCIYKYKGCRTCRRPRTKNKNKSSFILLFASVLQQSIPSNWGCCESNMYINLGCCDSKRFGLYWVLCKLFWVAVRATHVMYQMQAQSRKARKDEQATESHPKSA